MSYSTKKVSAGKLWEIAEREYHFWKVFHDVFGELDLATVVRAVASHYPANLQRYMFNEVWERIETLWYQDVKEGRI